MDEERLQLITAVALLQILLVNDEMMSVVESMSNDLSRVGLVHDIGIEISERLGTGIVLKRNTLLDECYVAGICTARVRRRVIGKRPVTRKARNVCFRSFILGGTVRPEKPRMKSLNLFLWFIASSIFNCRMSQSVVTGNGTKPKAVYEHRISVLVTDIHLAGRHKPVDECTLATGDRGGNAELRHAAELVIDVIVYFAV